MRSRELGPDLLWAEPATGPWRPCSGTCHGGLGHHLTPCNTSPLRHAEAGEGERGRSLRRGWCGYRRGWPEPLLGMPGDAKCRRHGLWVTHQYSQRPCCSSFKSRGEPWGPQPQLRTGGGGFSYLSAEQPAETWGVTCTPCRGGCSRRDLEGGAGFRGWRVDGGDQAWGRRGLKWASDPSGCPACPHLPAARGLT